MRNHHPETMKNKPIWAVKALAGVQYRHYQLSGHMSDICRLVTVASIDRFRCPSRHKREGASELSTRDARLEWVQQHWTRRPLDLPADARSTCKGCRVA